jgi:hypothetical protein
MGTEYIVQAGDYLVKIAKDHGYESWKEIYYHPDNAPYRKKRPDPNVIYAGDVLILPDQEPVIQPVPPWTTPPGTTPPSGIPPGGIPPGWTIPWTTPPTNVPPLAPDKEMYNLFWLFPLPPGAGGSTPVTLEGQNTINTPGPGIEAIVLYPAFLTPEIVVGDDKLELLVLTKNGYQLLPADVNLQLKYSIGLDPTKPYFIEPLFPGPPDQFISIVGVPFNDSLSTTEKRFACLTDAWARKMYQDAGFNTLFWVSIRCDFLFQKRNATGTLGRWENGYLKCGEVQDLVVGNTLLALNGKKLPCGGGYTFPVDGDNINLGMIEPWSPVQSYHPLFYYKALGHVSFGHLADLHLNSRQNLLARSQARVIEFHDPLDNAGPIELDEDVSPPVGPMISICGRSSTMILYQMGADPQIDVILVTGDMIDFVRSWFPLEPHLLESNPTIRQIWDRVSVGSGYEERCQDFVDMICFYSLIYHSYITHRKPVFAVAGNHDCYFENYGISPRALGVIRANAGIAADHNLTIYEAILAFGDSYGTTNTLHWYSAGFFQKAEFAWFYAALTPFSDFVSNLPRQSLVCLAWGDDEDQMDPFADQGVAHLPRASEALSDRQDQFVKWAIPGFAQGRRIFLVSHFTYVNYDNPVPFWKFDQDVGWVRNIGRITSSDDGSWTPNTYGNFDYGTFEEYRETLIGNILMSNVVHCALSGHSHRRGLYALLGAEEGTQPLAIRTLPYGIHELPQMQADKPGNTAIVVCDSAGSLPRFNWLGEFEGVGSDYPSGTRVLVDKESGNLLCLEPIRALHPTCRPRLGVVLDYLDINAKGSIFDISSDPVSMWDEGSDGLDAYSFCVGLANNVRGLVQLQEMRLYFTDPQNGWQVCLQFQPSGDRWWLTGNDAKWFYFISRVAERRHFMAMKFAPLDPVLLWQYDPGWWTFECSVGSTGDDIFGPWPGGSSHYEIRRLHFPNSCDVPDLEWRQEAMPKYQ